LAQKVKEPDALEPSMTLNCGNNVAMGFEASGFFVPSSVRGVGRGGSPSRPLTDAAKSLYVPDNSAL